MAELTELVKTDEALRFVVRDIHRLLNANLLQEQVEVLDAYQTSNKENRWVVYAPERGFALLGDVDAVTPNPILFFTSSLFLAYALDPDTSAVQAHKERTQELQAELARRFPEPIGSPSVSVLMTEAQAASVKLVVLLLQLSLGWDRMSITLSPSPTHVGGAFNFFADPDGAWSLDELPFGRLP